MSDFSEAFLKAANTAAVAEAGGIYHKGFTAAWYKARKTIRGIPRQVLGKAVSLGTALVPVPGFSDVVSKAVDAGLDKIKGKWAETKRAKAKVDAESGDLEALRKWAKGEAKDFTKTADQINTNQVKLKDINLTTETWIKQLNGEPDWDTYWKAACSMYERRRRAQKIILLSAAAQAQLQEMDKYFLAVMANVAEQEECIGDLLDQYEDNYVGALQDKAVKDEQWMRAWLPLFASKDVQHIQMKF